MVQQTTKKQKHRRYGKDKINLLLFTVIMQPAKMDKKISLYFIILRILQ